MFLDWETKKFVIFKVDSPWWPSVWPLSMILILIDLLKVNAICSVKWCKVDSPWWPSVWPLSKHQCHPGFARTDQRKNQQLNILRCYLRMPPYDEAKSGTEHHSTLPVLLCTCKQCPPRWKRCQQLLLIRGTVGPSLLALSWHRVPGQTTCLNGVMLRLKPEIHFK